MLPNELAGDLMLKMGSFGDYYQLKEHVRTKCELMVYMKGKTGSVHHVDGPGSSVQSERGAGPAEQNLWYHWQNLC